MLKGRKAGRGTHWLTTMDACDGGGGGWSVFLRTGRDSTGSFDFRTGLNRTAIAESYADRSGSTKKVFNDILLLQQCCNSLKLLSCTICVCCIHELDLKEFLICVDSRSANI